MQCIDYSWFLSLPFASHFQPPSPDIRIVTSLADEEETKPGNCDEMEMVNLQQEYRNNNAVAGVDWAQNGYQNNNAVAAVDWAQNGYTNVGWAQNAYQNNNAGAAMDWGSRH